MKTRAIMALMAVAGTAAVASAQGTATYSIAFGSAGGPNTVQLNPGQSTSVFVNVSFSPGVGGGTPPAAGLSDGGFGINGGGGGWSGGALPNPWGAQAVGGVGVNAGTGSATGVSGVVWGYGFLFNLPHPFPQNPANVWTGTYTAGATAGVFNVSFAGLAPTGVFAGATGLPTVVTYASNGGQGGSITIVPAPASLALLGLGGLVAARRRRA